MDDHDQRFKNLLREFFYEFMWLFFPQWAERFDFSHVEWLDKEVFTDPPQGERRYLDMVAKLATRQAVAGQRTGEQKSWLALIHVEIEAADSVAPLRSRVYEYYEHLRKRYRMPVLPIGLYLRVALDGLGTDVYEEYFWEFRLLRFEYLYVGLPGLDAKTYLEGENWLGVALAALMNISPEQRAWLAAEALRKLVQSPQTDVRRYLLCECVDSYAPFDDAQWQVYQDLCVSKPEVANMVGIIDRRAQEKIMQGQRQILLCQLEQRFAPLSEQVKERLEACSSERLAELARVVWTAPTLKSLGLED